MAETLWELNKVSLGRPTARRLADVSLTIREGVTAVIGPSGAGKTSLLNLLTGFESPDAGDLTARLTTDTDRLPLGWVPPDFGLWPHLTVREHLDTVRSAERPPSEICDLLEAFGLQTLADANVGRLSQGERSRLAVARALCSDPAVLVMDEPLVHVDPTSLDRCWQSLRRHGNSRGTSLVFSTHSTEIVLREASRVVCLDRGCVAFEGDVASLYDEPPTSELARLLGPCNWFAADESARWLAGTDASSEKACVRPDRLVLVPVNGASANGDGLRLHATRRVGTMIESEVEHEPTGERRTLVHRPGDGLLVEGMREFCYDSVPSC